VSLKVLLADDSMTAQNMGRKILSESGYDVTTVSNGAAAVKKIAELKPDLVILDIYMPGYTGLEVCERVRANFDTSNLPVLLTVGKMEPYRAEDGAKVRADGVIVKPFEATDLLAIVKKLSEKISVAPARRVVEEEPEQEETTFQQFSQPEHSMPSHVDVPSEIAVAPALAMEEFNTGQAAAAAFAAPVMDWSAPVELAVEQAPAEASAQFADIPWSFDQPVATDESAAAMEKSAMVELGPSPDVEFTSAPRVGEIEVERAAELESTASDASVEVEPVTEPALANAQEVTDFATSFGIAHVEENHEPEVSGVGASAPEESSWDGWAQLEAKDTEEPKPESVIDDFEAKVAAAMSGFGTEPVEPAHESAQSEMAAQPVDDFEARVAAAMSGFATEPVPAQEPTAETQQEVVSPAEPADDFEARVAAAMSGFSSAEPEAHEAFVEAQETVVEPQPEVQQAVEAPASAEDFDARLAEAMAAFDHTPEAVPDISGISTSSAEETQEFDVPALAKPAINLNETTVLPQEAVLSLEEEMKRASELHVSATEEHPVEVADVPTAPESISWQFSQVETREAEVVHAAPELPGEFDPMHVAHDVEPTHEEPITAEAMAATTTSSVLNSALSAFGGEKLADAVQKAVERLKPQLIAEIVKELKGE
jgi:CheY-like chemotaxis protein